MTHSKRVQMYSVACCSVTDVQTINLRYGDIHTETTLTPTEDEIVTNRQTEGSMVSKITYWIGIVLPFVFVFSVKKNNQTHKEWSSLQLCSTV